jgi:NMD protein affecting ribosome stability and mRNA decay
MIIKNIEQQRAKSGDNSMMDIDQYDDIDIDVCQGCGVYYIADERNRELWIESYGGIKPKYSVQPQLCNKCMRGENDY